MPELTFTKHHGLGNDFLVLLGRPDRDLDTGALARAVCDRRRGIGADGLILVTLGPGGDGDDSGFDVSMELRNADGGRAEMSGNGIRCLAQAVVDAGVVDGPDLRVATDAGVRYLTVAPETEAGVRQVTVEMGAVTVSVSDPGRAEVDTGNPHLVLLARDVAGADLEDLGRRHPDVNVEVIAQGPEPDALELRVHERGVGITEACGTGSCAAAAAARVWGLVGDRVLVHNPGGDVTVDFKSEGVLLTGPTQYVGRVHVPWPPGEGLAQWR